MTEPSSTGSLIGAEIGGLSVVAVLGSGGMGEVYKAFDPQLQRFAAIKMVAPTTATDETFVARFEREARAASAINHPNVAQIYSFGRWQGRPYYVMELVAGQSLAELLKSRGRLSGFECLDYLEQACEGLRAAQRHGIIHRDIKPANLMIDADDHLKIVDFGLARRTGDKALTQTDLILGTPGYMAPEQALAAEIDFRSDIYSLGATFYHLLSGEPPFTAETPIALMMMHLQQPLVPLKERNPRVPEPVCRVIDRMMAKEPAARYQSYDELIADLGLLRAGKTELMAASVTGREAVAEASPERPAAKPSDVSRLLRWIVALLVVAVAVAVVGYLQISRKVDSALARRAAPSPGAQPAKHAPSPGPGEQRAPVPTPPRTEPAFPVQGSEHGESRSGGAPLAPSPPKTQPDITPAKMARLSAAIQQFRAERGRLPRSLAELAREYPGHPRLIFDEWGNHLVYRITEKGHFRLISKGPDGVLHTADDIVMDDGVTVSAPPPQEPGADAPLLQGGPPARGPKERRPPPGALPGSGGPP